MTMLKIKLYTLLLAFTSLIIMFSCEKKHSLSYTVKGKLENVKDSTFIAVRETGDSLIVDTIQINKKGEFSFQGTVDTLTVISLYFKESTDSPYILVDKGWDVEVKGDIELADLISVKGGNINDDLTKFKSDNKDLLLARSEMIREKRASADSISRKDQATDFKNVSFELLNNTADYVKNNPTKISSVILINNFFKKEESIERLSDALAQLKGAAYDFPLAAHLKEYNEKVKKSVVGSQAPPFRLKDLNGKDVSLSDFRGKYVLLSFVSTTCGVCEDMRPNVVKEYDILKKEKMNIEFISIIKDVEEVTVTKDTRKGIKWVTLPEYGGWSSLVFEDYNIKEIPFSILISKEGKILERNVPIFNLKNKLAGYPDIKKK